MNTLTKKFHALAHGISEGQRWSGRTQSHLSRTFEQRAREARTEIPS